MRGRSQPVWLMELLQSLLNNPLNLDLISYPCSEHGFLARDPGITSAAELWVSAVCLKTGQRGCCHPVVIETIVMLNRAQPGLQWQNKHNCSHPDILFPLPQTENMLVLARACSRREVKRTRGARWSGFPQSLSFTHVSLFAFWQMFLLLWIKCSALTPHYEL